MGLSAVPRLPFATPRPDCRRKGPRRHVFRTIRWKLITTSLLVIGLPLLAFSYFLLTRLWGFYLDQLEDELTSKAGVIADTAGPVVSPHTPNNPVALRQLVDRWRRYSNMSLTIIDEKRQIVAATNADEIGQIADDANKPGMREALQGTKNSTVWKSPNFDYQDTMYVNIPLRQDGEVVGAARVAYSLQQIQRKVAPIKRTVAVILVAYACIIVGLTLWQAGSIVRPIESLEAGARRIAAGDLDHRLEVRGTVEITHLAETLNQTSQRLSHLEGMRRRYVSNVSHELRTPLAAIRGMAETLIQHASRDPALLGRYLPRIVSQTDRLARLATQLLDLAQIESGNLVGEFAPVKVRAVTDEVMHLCAQKAEQKGVRLVSDIPEGTPEIHGDHDRLLQVLLNLVDNALRYTPDGGSVRVAARPLADSLEIRVEDTGEGIPAAHLPHLFERFYRVDQARTRDGGGTGLGLSIARQIVEAHGGAISVESVVGEGTRFIILLPLFGADGFGAVNAAGPAPARVREEAAVT